MGQFKIRWAAFSQKDRPQSKTNSCETKRETQKPGLASALQDTTWEVNLAEALFIIFKVLQASGSPPRRCGEGRWTCCVARNQVALDVRVLACLQQTGGDAALLCLASAGIKDLP